MARKKAASAQLTLDVPVPTRALSEEVEAAFLDYSMSVIVSRALPDVRDGLKPVHRRILWAMHDAGLRPDRSFVKCARVVGDVMGRFHPHGDTAIYEALVRLGQDFSLPHPLVDKHGNFGSPSDPPAAQRYTECRLSEMAMRMLADIDEDTVDVVPNYDASDEEPSVLPARFPNLLVNGGQGIAVGMATNIPPHNLAEVCAAALHVIDHPGATAERLAKFVTGPDFPTGALIMGRDGIDEAYRTGRGSLRLRARTELEETRRGTAIVVTEVPYQTSVDAIAGKLAEVVEAGKVDGIRDIRNESGQGKTRLVIELRSDANPQIVLNNLFKHTPAQITFGVNMVALVDGVPRTLDLGAVLRAWLDHQVLVVTRRTRFRLERADARLHIVEGLLRALDMIDAVVATIRGSNDRATARAALMAAPFEFSEVQANHILDLTLGRLTKLGRTELTAEAKELTALVRELRKVLAKRDVLLGVIRDELVAIRDTFRRPRRTEIVLDDTGTIETQALIEDDPMTVAVTARGYVRAVAARARGGKAIAPGARDALVQVIDTTALSAVLFFTDRGRAYRAFAHELPKERLSAVQNLFQLGDGERLVGVVDAQARDEHDHLVFVTEQGTVKRTALAEFADASGRRDGVVAMKLGSGDRVVAVFPGWDDYELLLVTAGGSAVRFPEAEVRPVGRSAGGIRGIRLRAGDRVVGAAAVAHEEVVALATAGGYAKRVAVDEFPVQARGGAGVKAARVDATRGEVVGVASAAEHLVVVGADAAASFGATELRLAPRDGGGSALRTPAAPFSALFAAPAPAEG
ncbi:MAG TPA: DNA topoisomerase (ATP-hydrolyzing) [Acidimicrobiia bacterium]|nr:DNA topoisomerase (ATP-hydrolyzing) [Acidimicrobiia bacterium]